MATTLTCSSCKSRFALKSEHAGRRLKCGKCGQPLDAPAEKPAQTAPLTVACNSCGARFSLKPEHAGRRLKCGKCGQEISVSPVKPAASAPAEPVNQNLSPAGSKPAPVVKPAPATDQKKNDPKKNDPKKTASGVSSSLGSLPPLMSDALLSSLASPVPPAASMSVNQSQNTQLATASANNFWDEIPPGGFSVAPPAAKMPAIEETQMPRVVNAKKKTAGMPFMMQVGAFLLAGVVVAPVIYFIAQCFVSSLLALLIAALALNFMAAVGSFAVACLIFGQKIPGFDEIIRLVRFGSTIPMVLLFMLILSGSISKEILLTALGLLAPGIIFSAWRCIAHLNMAVPQAVLVSVSYNLGAAAMTAAGCFMLGAMFLHGGGLDDLTRKGGGSEIEEVLSPEELKAEANAADEFAAKLLSDPQQIAEARAWLAGPSSGKEHIAWQGERAAMVKFIDDLYAAGAKQITAIFGDTEIPGMLTEIIIALPDTPDARQKVFAVHDQFWKKVTAPEDPEEEGDTDSYLPKDTGQKYLLDDFN
jgi:hypothetical protein